MHRKEIIEKVKAGEIVEVPWLLLANGGITQQVGLTIDESIKKWAKDNSIFVTYRTDLHFGKERTIVIFEEI